MPSPGFCTFKVLCGTFSEQNKHDLKCYFEDHCSPGLIWGMGASVSFQERSSSLYNPLTFESQQEKSIEVKLTTQWMGRHGYQSSWRSKASTWSRFLEATWCGSSSHLTYWMVRRSRKFQKKDQRQIRGGIQGSSCFPISFQVLL